MPRLSNKGPPSVEDVAQGDQSKASPPTSMMPLDPVVFVPLERWKPVGVQASMELAG